MSRDADDSPRRREERPAPKRPKPTPPKTEADPFGDTEPASTFRPASASPPPARPGRPRPPSRPTNGGTTEPDEYESELLARKPPTTRSKASATKGTRNLDEPRPVRDGGSSMFERVLFGSVSSSLLARFCRQAASYQNAGVDLLKTFDGLKTQFAATALGPVITRMATRVRRGETLSDAVAAEPQAFDRLFVSMVKVAEARGGLPETLQRMAQHYESRQRLIRQARGALIMPTIVLIGAVAVGLLLTIFVLPKLVDILADMVRGKAVDLPLPTRLLMGLSGFVQAMGWWLLPLAFVGGLVGLFQVYKTRVGKGLMDEIALYVPVLGMLLRKIDTARFARTLATLLDAGVDFGESIQLTAGVMHLSPFRRALVRVRDSVMDGSELSDALDETRRFSPDVVAIVQSGEESGRLPESLDKLAENYEDQVDDLVKNLGLLIQPVLTILIGGVVLFIALAFIMAYVSVLSGLSGGM